MFTMTPHARSVIRRVTAHPSLDEKSGLRIAGGRAEPAPLKVSVAKGPQPGDQVIERDGARVYLGRGVAGRIRGRRLDAVRERSGRVQFVVRAQ